MNRPDTMGEQYVRAVCDLFHAANVFNTLSPEGRRIALQYVTIAHGDFQKALAEASRIADVVMDEREAWPK